MEEKNKDSDFESNDSDENNKKSSDDDTEDKKNPKNIITKDNKNIHEYKQTESYVPETKSNDIKNKKNQSSFFLII